MRRIGLLSFVSILVLTLSAQFSRASGVSLEREIQTLLERSKGVLGRIEERLDAGRAINSEITQLQKLVDEINATHLLLSEQFRSRQKEVKVQGARAQQRHRAMWEGYRRALEEYLGLAEGLLSGNKVSRNGVERLQNLLRTLVPEKKRPLFGSLPYEHLNYPPIDLNAGPAIKPAYRGGNKAVSPDDLKGNPEAPVNKEIAELAQSLSWNPVLIYEWVKNTTETEWYWGCMKGAEETLRQMYRLPIHEPKKRVKLGDTFG